MKKLFTFILSAVCCFMLFTTKVSASTVSDYATRGGIIVTDGLTPIPYTLKTQIVVDYTPEYSTSALVNKIWFNGTIPKSQLYDFEIEPSKSKLYSHSNCVASKSSNFNHDDCTIGDVTMIITASYWYPNKAVENGFAKATASNYAFDWNSGANVLCEASVEF